MSASTATAQPPHSAFAARLKSARLRSGKSQEQIALEVGTSRRHWIRWERGFHLPSQAFIVRIAEATGQTAQFFTGEPVVTSAPTKNADDAEESDLVADLYNVVRRLVRAEVAAAA